MRVEQDPDWVETWQNAALFGVYFWGQDRLLTWYRLSGCDVEEALAWARRRADGGVFSLALLLSDPTERPADQDGLVWLAGGNVLAGDQPAR